MFSIRATDREHDSLPRHVMNIESSSKDVKIAQIHLDGL